MRNQATAQSTEKGALDQVSYRIMLSLQHNPLISINALSKKLGVSTTLVKSRFDNLKTKGILRPDEIIMVPFLGKRLRTEVEAVIRPWELGLYRVHIVFNGIPHKKKLNELHTLLSIHPYSHYHITAFGGKAFVYAQIDIPGGGINHLYSLLKHTQEVGYCDSVITLQQEFIGTSKSNLSEWDASKRAWKYEDGGDLNSALHTLWTRFVDSELEKNIMSTSPRDPIQFTLRDLMLIRELTVNSKLNISEIAPHYGVDRTSISKRLKFLRDSIAPENRLFYNPKVFDISVPILLVGKFNSKSDLSHSSLSAFLNSNTVPLTISSAMTKRDYILFAHVPPSIAPMLSKFVWEHTAPQLMLQLDLSSARTHYFFHGNYIGNQKVNSNEQDSEGGWKISRDYIVDQPIDTIERIFS